MDTPADPNAASSRIEAILSSAARTLGSIQTPDYRQIKLNAQRYARLIIDLSADFWIRDTSDVNADVSSVLLLRKENLDAREEYILYISNVGNYAFSIRVDETNSHSEDIPVMIKEILRKNGLESLPKDILSTPVNSTTFYSDRPTLFNVLFSDTEFLPWHLTDQGSDTIQRDL
jgi:hypothetical protein